MATIIDSLIVKLGLDSSEFKSGTSKVGSGLQDVSKKAEKTGKDLKKATKDGSDGFKDVARETTKFLAILGGTAALKTFLTQMVENNAALNRFAINMKEGVSTVSAWQNAVEIASGSADGFQGTMSMLSKSQTELMLTGQSGLIPYFSALGVSLADAHGKARPVNDLLLDLSSKFAGMDRTTANNMGQMMGIDPNTMNLLLKGRQEVELMIRRQKEYGAVTKKQAEEASLLQRVMIESKQTFQAFGREIMSAALPYLEKLLGVFSDLGSWIASNKEFVATFLTIIAVGLAAVAAATMPINLTVIAVAALAAGIAALYQDYQTWKRGGESLIDWGKWEPGFKNAGQAMKILRDVCVDGFFRIFAAADAARLAITGDWSGAKEAWGSAVEGTRKSEGGASGGGGKSLPRGIRNNNPGNLNFAGQKGATKEGGAGGRFAVFGSMQEGVAALVRQIGLYVKRGKNTIRQIIETYAPSSENDTGSYINAVSKALGLGADDPLDADNANQVMGLVRAITNHENGKGFVSDADISGGYAMAKGGAGQFSSGAGAATSAGAPVSAPMMAAGGNSNETHIGEIKVFTAATDANGIAKDMGKSMNFLFASQANYGLM